MSWSEITAGQLVAMNDEEFEKWTTENPAKAARLMDPQRRSEMGNSTRSKGGKAAPVPISMHPKGGGHPIGGVGAVKGGGSKGGGGGASSKGGRYK